jgi:hypothetical protein
MLSLVGCSATPTNIMFENLLSRKHVKHIKKLQGGGLTWQGYSVMLRFTASPEIINEIFSENYTPAKWSSVKHHCSRQDITTLKYGSTNFINFNPKWAPEKIIKKDVIEWKGENNWTRSGHHIAIIDRKNNTVYFCGSGT